MKQTIDVEGLPEGWKAVKATIQMCQCDDTNTTTALAVIALQKIQPRRIVLEETEEDNELDKFGDPVEQQFSNGAVIYSEKIWREVKEEES